MGYNSPDVHQACEIIVLIEVIVSGGDGETSRRGCAGPGLAWRGVAASHSALY